MGDMSVNRSIFLLFVVLLGCDQSFDPRAPITEIPVVFSILANDKATQFVRIYTTYDAYQTGTPAEKPITDALVTISDGSRSYVLVDTMLTRPDTGRYTTPIRAYVASGFDVLYGRTYTLQIQSPTIGNISASLATPSTHFLSVGGAQFLDHPHSWPLAQELTATARTQSRGYVIRLYVEYETLEDSTWVLSRREVPVTFRKGRTPSISTALYPIVLRNPSGANVIQHYTNEAYLIALNHVSNTTSPKKIVFKQVVIMYIQIEEHLYGYYGTVNGFFDPFTIRLDRPNSSNISNGAGVFGGYMIDTVKRVLPSTFDFNRE